MINYRVNKSLNCIFICLFIFVFSFLFNVFGVSAKTIGATGSYADECFIQDNLPGYFQENIGLLNSTPFWLITETISNNNITYSLYAFNTNDIFFNLSGGTWYTQVKNNTDTFNLSLWSCTTELLTSDDEFDDDIRNSKAWSNNWNVSRDFNNNSWNRNLFRKWDDNTITYITYNLFMRGIQKQIDGDFNNSNYGFIISSNFDLYNSSNLLVLSSHISEPEPEPVPPTTDDYINNINNNLTSVPDITKNSNDINNLVGYLPPGPVDSILTLPLSLMNNLLDNLDGNSCNDLSIRLPFINQNISIPCVKTIYSIIGINTFFESTGIIASAFILYSYFLHLYSWVDEVISLKTSSKVSSWGELH